MTDPVMSGLWIVLLLCVLYAFGTIAADIVTDWRRDRRVRRWIAFGLTRAEAERAAEWDG